MQSEESPIAAVPATLGPPLRPPQFEPPRSATRPSFGSPDHYHSPSRIAISLQIAILASMGAYMLDLASVVRAMALLHQLDSSPQLVRVAEIQAVDDRSQVLGWICLGLTVVFGGFLIALTRRLYRNVPTLSNYPRRFTDGWAVGAWFVPFLNFVRPKQIVDDIWRATSPEQPAWWPQTRPPVSKLLHVWWASVIITGLLVRGTGDSEGATDLDTAREILHQRVGIDIVATVFAILTFVVGWRLVARDRERASTVFQRDLPVRRSLSIRLVGAAAIAVAALSIGLVVFQPSQASSGNSTTVHAGDEGLLVMELAVGDCFDFPPEDEQHDADGTLVLVGVTSRSCDAPHDAEVYALLTHPAAKGAKYPGDSAMFETAKELCLEQFEPVIGTAFQNSSLDVFFLIPQESWSVGDREIDCIATRMTDESLTESVIDSGL